MAGEETTGEIIRLLDSSGKKVLDSVSAEYEDSFCLESFGDLCQSHINAEPVGTKCFIIARVQTWDHKQPDKAFYSYYNAYHLNKILFQTQIYLGKKLIHRLHVLNPLTNTDIIGNVQYFLVQSEKIAGSSSEGIETNNNNIIIATSYLNPESTTITNTATTTSTSIAGRIGPKGVLSPTSKQPLKRNKKGITPILTNVNRRERLLPPPSPAVREVERTPVQSWTLTQPSVKEVNEEEEEFHDGHAPGSARAIKKIRKLSAAVSGAVTDAVTDAMNAVGNSNNKRGAFTPISAPPDIEKGVDPYNRVLVFTKSLKSPKTPGYSPASVDHTNESEHPTSSFNMRNIVKPPDGPINIRNHRRNKTAVPSGVVTRFAVPVRPEDLISIAPPTDLARRRTLSYMNSVNASGEPATLEEWKEMVKEDQKQIHSAIVENAHSINFDEVKPFRSSLSPVRATTSIHGNSPPKKSPLGIQVNDSNHVQLSSNANLMSTSVDEESALKDDKDAIYDAILFATDNDFLESGRIRAIFKENAVNPEDAQLFEMPPFTGEEESPVTVVVDDSEICEWCYPSQVTLDNSGSCMRVFHQTKCYLLALILMSGMFIFIYIEIRNQNDGHPSSPTPT